MTERLDRLGLDPIAALARLAQNAEAEGNLALAERCWSGLLPYAGPRPTVLREGFSAPDKGLPAEGISRPEKNAGIGYPQARNFLTVGATPRAVDCCSWDDHQRPQQVSDLRYGRRPAAISTTHHRGSADHDRSHES
jgi:hypothetical protein